VWALIGQHLFNATVDTLILWGTVKWRPKKIFSFQRLKSLLGFGSKILGISLTNTIYEDIRQLLIGKLYLTSDLAFYNKAKQFPSLFNTNINASIDSILLPVMSREQGDLGAVKAITRRSIKTSTYIMAPILVGLAMCGDAFIELLLTEKWLPCVPYMRIFCITYIFTPMFTANYNAYKALGRSDLYLKVSIISKIFGIGVLLVTLPYGVMTIAYGLLVSNFISQLVCTFPNIKLLNYSYPEQIKDILPNLLLAAFMGAIVYSVEFLNLSSIVTLIIQIPLGVAAYVLGSMIFKLESYVYVLNSAKSFLKRRKV
jgi:O-antigen/teichoic acid export membrane protein